ncbi:glycoside hydrolase family 3 C-terminal domain-containing protein [Pinibacter soli]|uniref:Glycoside hydrolase family 3 C-terminal domain-containing protein n=1 Tax=Pinibacter soli TaxID=3044211 RepID=A0ABT6RE64_9BACT|nr:glycoside hydrolase family 3 C-terminal domain-containing protein [Pinibacter soli]MDI3320874.1 glycoside hydrolase family 3 C-terminal domain-containing protein [Pinibacter soli]
MKLTKTIFFAVAILCRINGHAQTQPSQLPFWNYKLGFKERVDDLVGRLTLEEKVAQMLNHAPAIPRLGIPAYDWWNEVLHGVARTPFKTTVYPQAIAMAATWDTTALYTMADQSAMEGRAIHNKAIASGKTGERYWGLTYWTPNINIFRDPRWGRGQETYGEDPFLTAMLGKAFVHGLQGDDPKYLKAAACAKHYAIHSGPEPSRHEFNVDVSAQDLWETYLPAFKELVTDAHVAGVMCAYNAFRKQPCCGSDLLMIDILRNQWKFNGYVTSDCWAIDDFFKHHKTHTNAETASADAVFHGTDVECGTDAYLSLVKAVKDGIIKESQITVSVKRLFMIRMQLGMFDPASEVVYAQTPTSVLESGEHKAQALKMAQESIVLLKNENNTLPLSKSLKKIAVVGPNAENSIAVLGNYNGTPSEIVTALNGIGQKVSSDTKVVYEQAVNFTNDTLLAFTDISAQCAYEGKHGFKAEYFANRQLGASPIVVNENEIDHFWQEGQQVTGSIKANDFSARYTTNFTAGEDGYITFQVQGDDGYKFMINDKEVINAWERNRWGARTYRLDTKKGEVYKLVLEYWQGDGKASVALKAGKFVKTDFNALANRLADADAIIFVGGISPQLEGEEMKVDYPGFNGGDRTSILLPSVQTELLKTLQKTGKPVVFVMMTGSAIAMPWESVHIPAIVNAWYGGQSAGTAIADVLFGDYNPSGRLPVTFYKSDADLGSFEDYSMNNRTYRYFKGEPLYPFGYGLSYTSFQYKNLVIPAAVKANANIPVDVTVTNTGKRAGEEVVQLYISYQGQSFKVARKALKGFKRIHLKPGETSIVHFTLTAKELAVANANGKMICPAGKLVISVGGGQPGVKNIPTGNVLQKDIKIN